ncbi:hypothetical protein Hhel01_03588 [Haloferula helveola]
MSPEEVLSRLGPNENVVSRSADRIVTQGYDKDWESVRKNEYIFIERKLAIHKNEPLQP